MSSDAFGKLLRWVVLAVWAATSTVLAIGTQNAESVMASPDPTVEDLDIEIVDERIAEGVVLSRLYFTSHRIDDDPVRIFGLYARPVDVDGLLPGILFIHGGGQTADELEVIGWAQRGYAAFSHDWNPTETVDQERRPNRWPSDDQGRRKQAEPAELDEALWIARRALTLLERQPQVDPLRLGVSGFSWGGHHTWNVTAHDARVKAAIPSCGRLPRDVVDNLRAPVLFTNASEDFFGRMDAIQSAMTDVTVDYRLLVAPNENHNLAGVPWERTREAWFDHYLRNGPPLAPHPRLFPAREEARASVSVQAPGASDAELFYSYGDSASGDRCWFALPLQRAGDGEFTGTLPMRPGLRIWSFANCSYPDGTLFSTEYAVAEPLEEALEPLLPTAVLYDPATDGRHPWYFSWRGPVARHPWHPWGGTDMAVSEIAGRPALQTAWGNVERPDQALFRAFLRSPGCPTRRGTGAEGVQVDVIGPRPLRLLLVAHESGHWRVDRNPFQIEVTLESGEGWESIFLSLRDFRRRTPREEAPDEAPASFEKVRQFHVTLEAPQDTETPVAIGRVQWMGRE